MNTNKFIVSDEQIKLEQKMVPYDLWATKVHVLMLEKQNIINNKIAGKIIKALDEITTEYSKGKFIIDPDKGLHLTIEAMVTEKIGNDGYYMHTARSRNDQVMTAEMLYIREKVLEITNNLLKLIKTLIYLTNKNIQTIMPGYTHMQPAKPTTFGQWCLAYSDMFFQCINTLKHVCEKYDKCPLGAVESYGTSWNIDRTYTADLLGFSIIWEIPQDAISSRGFFQLAILGVLKDISIVISKITSDLLLFTTYEYGYITLSDSVAQQMGNVTGSSIMPQKKNPDILEILRSITPQLIGYESIIANLLSNLPMGYNRDTREVKEYIESGLSKVENSLICLGEVLQSMTINKEKMYQSVLANYSLATDLTDYICQKSGLPYRKVYKVVGLLVKNMMIKKIPITQVSKEELMECGKEMRINITLTDSELKTVLDPLVAINKRKHMGGAANSVMKKMINKRNKILKNQNNWVNLAWEKINYSKKKTAEEIKKL